MKVHILSDLHLEAASFVPPITHADVIILAGDIGVGCQGIEWARDAFEVPVIYVPGNHEYHDLSFSMGEHREDMLRATSGSQVSLLDNDVTVINGVRFIGTTMWTDLNRAP